MEKEMLKLNDFWQYIIGLFSYFIFFLALFSAFAAFSPSHAADIKLVGCDVGFTSGSGKPTVMCSNPRYKNEKMKNFNNL
jgi:hypothetical protein